MNIVQHIVRMTNTREQYEILFSLILFSEREPKREKRCRGEREEAQFATQFEAYDY